MPRRKYRFGETPRLGSLERALAVAPHEANRVREYVRRTEEYGLATSDYSAVLINALYRSSNVTTRASVKMASGQFGSAQSVLLKTAAIGTILTMGDSSLTMRSKTFCPK